MVLKVIYKGDQDDTVHSIEGTQITWKEGKDPTKKKIKKKQKHKKTNETRTIVKTVEADSFFNVFTNRTVPEDGALDSEEENTIHDKVDEAMNLAEDIDDVLMPDALEYYLGLNEDFLGADEDDDDDDDHDDDNDSDDDNDKKPRKSSQEEGGKKKGGAKKGGDKKGGAGDQQ